MKSCMKYLLGAAAGIGMYALYEKYGSKMMKDMKSTVCDMSDDIKKAAKDMM